MWPGGIAIFGVLKLRAEIEFRALAAVYHRTSAEHLNEQGSLSEKQKASMMHTVCAGGCFLRPLVLTDKGSHPGSVLPSC